MGISHATRGSGAPSGPSVARRVHSYVVETGIDGSPAEVFGFCSDLRNELRWNPDARSIELLTSEPIGPGARFRARWRGAPEATVEVVRFDPPRSWETTTRTMGIVVRTSGSVEPGERGCRFRIQVDLQPRGLARLIAPLMIRLMARREPGNMARIRTAIEAPRLPGQREQASQADAPFNG